MNQRTRLIACAGIATLMLAACSAPTPTAVPPTAVPPTAAPTAVPPTAVPPTAVPPTVAPTAVPPTAVPPTAAPTAKPTVAPTAAAEEDVARPSNPGGPGPAVNLTGNVAAGAKVFADNCVKCHGEQGKGGVANPGSTDGTVPELNPIDETLIDKDPKVTVTNLDLFIEHGSTPGGKSPKEIMTAFGDKKTLTPQQIADVIAYVISLNK